MDDLFFYASKLFWTFSSPDHLLLLLFTLAILISRPDRRLLPEGGRKRSRKLLWFTLLLSWFIALYPLGNWLLHPLESRYPQAKLPQSSEISGVIVLGGAERIRSSEYWQSLELTDSGERITALLALLNRYPELPFIYTGGSGSVLKQDIKGSDYVRRFLATMGLEHRVQFERLSRNTYENAVFSKSLMSETQAPWLLVTSSFHLPRSIGVFQQQGIEVIPYPVDRWSLPPQEQGIYFNLSENLKGLKMGMREWIGLIAYRITGKTSQLLP